MSPANFSKHILLIYTTMFCIHSENDMFCSTYLRCSIIYWITFGLFFSFIFLLFLNRDVRDTWLYAERVSRINNVLNTTAFLVVFRCFWSFFSRFFHLSPSLKVRSFFGAEGGWGRFPSLFLQENEASMYPHWKERSLDGRGISTRLPFSMKVAN